MSQSDFIHVYAIVRIDQDVCPDEPFTNWIIKAVVASLEKARAELDRLNKLNNNKGCHYF